MRRCRLAKRIRFAVEALLDLPIGGCDVGSDCAAAEWDWRLVIFQMLPLSECSHRLSHATGCAAKGTLALGLAMSAQLIVIPLPSNVADAEADRPLGDESPGSSAAGSGTGLSSPSPGDGGKPLGTLPNIPKWPGPLPIGTVKIFRSNAQPFRRIRFLSQSSFRSCTRPGSYKNCLVHQTPFSQP